MAASLAWGGYSNGYIPAGAMKSIGRGFLLEAGAALQFLAVRAVLITVYGIDPLDYISETYRDYAGQVYQKKRWTALGKPNNAAEPGGSVHGWAKAIDFNVDAMSSGTYSIIMTILAQYGFIRDVAGESWHVSFREALISVFASKNTTPITDEAEEDDDMDYIQLIMGTETGIAYPYIYNDLDGMRHFVTPEEIFLIRFERKTPLKQVTIDQSRFDGIPKRPGSRDYNGEVQPLTVKDWEDAKVSV